jgi:hypothetical protein
MLAQVRGKTSRAANIAQRPKAKWLTNQEMVIGEHYGNRCQRSTDFKIIRFIKQVSY